MVVVTPSYGPDRTLFGDLHQSVLSCFPPAVSHVVVVPERDVAAFRAFEGPRCEVLSVRDVLPVRLRPVPRINAWVNLRRPLPPVRGWIMQQIAKLAFASQASQRVVVLADADVAFVRPVSTETFAPGGPVRFYRADGKVDATLPRHVRWHAVARQMLGLPLAPGLPLPDYISALNSWDRDSVRACLDRVEDVAGRSWVGVVASQLQFSEFILYGVHLDHRPERDTTAETDDPLCVAYWETVPLSSDSAGELAQSLSPTDVAVMISAKSQTPLDVRRRVIADLST